MNSVEILRQKQGVVAQTLENSLKHGKVAQGYLFVGNKGTIMLETAYLMATAIIGGSSNLDDVDEHLKQRIYDHTFLDVMVLDGSEKSIKRDEIDALQDKFTKTALEAYGKKVYIINAVENATTEALNALLKFLEEPQGDTYAILISYQVDRLLTTIISRCQSLKFNPMDADEIVEACLSKGIDEFDAKILSRIYYDEDLVIQTSEKKNYFEIRNAAIEYLSTLQDSFTSASITLQNFGKNIKDKNDCGLFLDILILYYQEVLAPSFEGDSTWENMKKHEIEKDVPKKLQSVLETRDDIRRNGNLMLLLDRMIYKSKF